MESAIPFSGNIFFKRFLIFYKLLGNCSIAFFISYSENIDPMFQRGNVDYLDPGLQSLTYPGRAGRIKNLEIEAVLRPDDKYFVCRIRIEFEVYFTGETQLHYFRIHGGVSASAIFDPIVGRSVWRRLIG